MCLAVPAKLLSVADSVPDSAERGAARMGVVDLQGSRLRVCLTLTPEALPGDWVLVHAGFAIQQLDEQEARETWRYLTPEDLADVPMGAATADTEERAPDIMKPMATPDLTAALHESCHALPPIRIMEVCGTHTVSLYRTGIKSLLPPTLRMVSGPGCPVCVSSQGYIDAACELAARREVTICSYGDMIRVPGRLGSLQQSRAAGADVRIVYSALDALRIAVREPSREVVFLAIGFETTTPGHAVAVREARRMGLGNFSLLTAQKLVVPAMRALLDAGDVPLDGFLCPGHVSVILGERAFDGIAEHYGKPCVIGGFEPGNMLHALLCIVRQVRAEAKVENVYATAVHEQGNRAARRVMDEVFEPADTVWRAMGSIAASGLVLRATYRSFDACFRFGLTLGPDYDPPGCKCGEVIQGKVEPAECALLARSCTPLHPIGPCMVSGEGTCAAAFRYGRGIHAGAVGSVEVAPA